jgi:putative photosynthetic complex assembly protein 2
MITAAAIAFVVLLWGISTAVIFYLDSLPVRTFPYSMAAATAVVGLCLVAIWWWREDATVLAVGMSFAAGLLIWGWTEMALYMGYVTGPRKHRCPAGCSGPAHFGHAVSANLWHELLVVALAGLIWVTDNQTALWCFVMLWLMHLSARLNVFLGVRNVSEEFVPENMEVLKGFLRRRNMNWLFPFSVTALVWLVYALATSASGFEATMAATLAAIGLLEHVLLMLPLPIEKIFRWSLSGSHKSALPGKSKDSGRHKNHNHTILGTLT